MASEISNLPGSFGSGYGTQSAADTRGNVSLPNAGEISAGNLGNSVGNVGGTKFAELVQLAATLGGQSGVTNSNGAPSIGGVAINFSPEDMAAALLVLQGKTQDAQLRTAREGLENSRLKMQDQNEKALAKINDWIKSCESAGAKDKAGGVMGWVSKIAGFVGALMATVVAGVAAVATGGAAAGDAVNGIAKTVGTAAKIGQAVAGITAGATAVARGGVQIAKAHDERDAALAQADKKTIDGVIAKLQQQMEDDRAQMKKVLDEIMQGANLVSQMINAAGDSRTQIAAHLNGKGQMI